MGIEMDPRPNIVSQGAGPKCWAGAMASWLTVNIDRMQLDMDTLIARYGDPKAGGSIKFQDEKFQKLQDDFRLSPSKVQKPTNKNARQFFAGVQTALKDFGYLIIIFSEGGGISHAMVVFGIRTIPNQGANLNVMDPAIGNFTFFRIDRLFGSSVVFLRTHEELNSFRKPFPTFTSIADGPPIKP
jgi:hypothetical protein